MALSKSRIDRLGARLKSGQHTEGDLLELDEYRRSFEGAHEQVRDSIRNELGIEATGRPAKTTNSIIDKLNRETIRLSQIQDIAGCRIVVSDVSEQDRVIDSLKRLFSNATIVDRRLKPSFEYRAVHVIATVKAPRRNTGSNTDSACLGATIREAGRSDRSFDQVRRRT